MLEVSVLQVCIIWVVLYIRVPFRSPNSRHPYGMDLKGDPNLDNCPYWYLDGPLGEGCGSEANTDTN